MAEQKRRRLTKPEMAMLLDLIMPAPMLEILVNWESSCGGITIEDYYED